MIFNMQKDHISKYAADKKDKEVTPAEAKAKESSARENTARIEAKAREPKKYTVDKPKADADYNTPTHDVATGTMLSPKKDYDYAKTKAQTQAARKYEEGVSKGKELAGSGITAPEVAIDTPSALSTAAPEDNPSGIQEKDIDRAVAMDSAGKSNGEYITKRDTNVANTKKAVASRAKLKETLQKELGVKLDAASRKGAYAKTKQNDAIIAANKAGLPKGTDGVSVADASGTAAVNRAVAKQTAIGDAVAKATANDKNRVPMLSLEEQIAKYNKDTATQKALAAGEQTPADITNQLTEEYKSKYLNQPFNADGEVDADGVGALVDFQGTETPAAKIILAERARKANALNKSLTNNIAYDENINTPDPVLAMDEAEKVEPTHIEPSVTKEQATYANYQEKERKKIWADIAKQEKAAEKKKREDAQLAFIEERENNIARSANEYTANLERSREDQADNTVAWNARESFDNEVDYNQGAEGREAALVTKQKAAKHDREVLNKEKAANKLADYKKAIAIREKKEAAAPGKFMKKLWTGARDFVTDHPLYAIGGAYALYTAYHAAFSPYQDNTGYLHRSWAAENPMSLAGILALGTAAGAYYLKDDWNSVMPHNKITNPETGEIV